MRELLLQEARRLAIDAAPLSDDEGRTETAEEASIRALVEREVSMPTPDEAACRRYYEQNLRRFRSADLYEAAHILIAARPARPRCIRCGARESGDADGRAACALRNASPSSPWRIRHAHRKRSGGNLGQLVAGDTTPEFDAALSKMAPDEMTAEPVASRFGQHIIRLDRKIEGRQLPFEPVRDRIAAYLVDRARHMAIAQFVARVAARAEVRGIDLPTPADLRVS